MRGQKIGLGLITSPGVVNIFEDVLKTNLGSNYNFAKSLFKDLF